MGEEYGEAHGGDGEGGGEGGSVGVGRNWGASERKCTTGSSLEKMPKMAKGEKQKLSPLIDSDVGKVQEIWVVNGETIMLIYFLPICIHWQSISNYIHCRHTVALSVWITLLNNTFCSGPPGMATELVWASRWHCRGMAMLFAAVSHIFFPQKTPLQQQKGKKESLSCY